MLRLTLEIVPHGIESRKRTVGTLHIINDGSGTIETGNYTGILRTDDPSDERHGRVEEYPRLSKPVWSLVGAFLELFGFTGYPTELMSEDPSRKSKI